MSKATDSFKIPIVETRRWKEDVNTGRRRDVEVVERRPATLDELSKANGKPKEISC